MKGALKPDQRSDNKRARHYEVFSRSIVRLIETSRQFGQAETDVVQFNPDFLTCAIWKGSRQ
jgi:hypothetical protein